MPCTDGFDVAWPSCAPKKSLPSGLNLHRINLGMTQYFREASNTLNICSSYHPFLTIDVSILAIHSQAPLNILLHRSKLSAFAPLSLCTNNMGAGEVYIVRGEVHHLADNVVDLWLKAHVQHSVGLI